MYYVTDVSWGDKMHTHLLTPEREPTMNQTAAKSNLVNQGAFLEVSYRDDSKSVEPHLNPTLTGLTTHKS